MGSNGTVVEFWHPFDDELGGKDMASIHLYVAAKMVAKASAVVLSRRP